MIHLTSSSLSSSQNVPSAQNIHMLTFFNEQQSFNNSNSENCWKSAQSFIKKDEIDSATRSTEWSKNQKDTHLSAQISKNQNKSQNQNSQKIISFTTVWKFHDDSTQTLEIQEQKKKYTQKIRSIKNCLLENRNLKIQKLRKLLPYFYNVPLPKKLKKMFKIADQIDKYLIERKNAQYTENVQNILKTLFHEQESSSIWSDIKKLLFICEDYYKIKIDPLKNICLSFKNKKDNRLASRKERLRKAFSDFYNEKGDSFDWQSVPQILTEPVKTPKFYPQNLNIQLKPTQFKLKAEFIQKVKQKVRNQQVLLCNQKQSKTEPTFQNLKNIQSLYELESFCDCISKIYAQKKVSHMYKVSLIENLRKKQTFSVEKIFALLKFIQQQGIFLEVLMKSGCQILRINQKEKKSLVQIAQMKMKQKKYQ